MIILEKISNIFTFMKPSKKAKHRTLVLVGSHGEIISIKRFFGLAVLATCVSIVTVVVIIYLVFTSSGLRIENKELNEALSVLQQETKVLKNENDIFMARLVAASEGELGKFEMKKSQAEKPSAARPYYEPSDQLNIEEEIKIAGRQLEKNQILEKSIEAENLIVTHESDTKTLRVRFDLRNADPDLNPVSGRTVVILKTGDASQNNWLTLPFVPLVSGKPASTTTGRTFLISRFKTVTFSIAGQTNPNRYKSATIYIFSKTGDTLLEKDFKVEVKEVLASAMQQNSQ
ncbi:MAG: coiled-coil domain-containing protein 30 [Desulfobacterales bacterium]|nr:coiled-coil domain-containing protein 30 [Desulfobacterales bacterium]